MLVVDSSRAQLTPARLKAEVPDSVHQTLHAALIS
jgi:hypothetical protein